MKTRKSPRLSVNFKIEASLDTSVPQKFSLSSGNRFEASAVDISISGIGMTSKFFLPKGLRLVLKLPLETENLITATGVVRYCLYIKPSSCRCGIEFVNLPQDIKKKIGEFVKKNEKRKEPRLKLED